RRDPVGGAARPRVTARDREAECHRGIEVRTRQRAEGRDRDGERYPVRERDVEQPATAAERDGQDGPGSDEEEPEGATGLGNERTRVAAQRSPSTFVRYSRAVADFRPVEATKARILSIHPAPGGTSIEDANAEWIEVVVQLSSDLANWRLQHLRALWREELVKPV